MSISEKIISWSSMNSDLLFLFGSLSIFILIISVFMMVIIISFLPEDYFKSENRNLISSVQNSRYPLLKLLVLITKNFFGVIHPDNKTITWVASNSRGYNMGKLLSDNRISSCYVESGIDATAGCADLTRK